MTKPQYNGKPLSEFNAWLRRDDFHPEISSKLNFSYTNIDGMWCKFAGYHHPNLEESPWMILETKNCNETFSERQQQQLILLNNSIQHKNFRGVHLLRLFEFNESNIFIKLDQKRDMTRKDLLEFLQFQKDDDWYKLRFW